MMMVMMMAMKHDRSPFHTELPRHVLPSSVPSSPSSS
jgi:hypothetical protein